MSWGGEADSTDREVMGGSGRHMNCVRFCKTLSYAHLLITGGTEGQARIWVRPLDVPPPR